MPPLGSGWTKHSFSLPVEMFLSHRGWVAAATRPAQQTTSCHSASKELLQSYRHTSPALVAFSWTL